MKIGIIVPTRGDRPEFLEYCKTQIKNQVIEHDVVLEIVDDKPINDQPDITFRYRIGLERLKNHGCDVAFFMEDDDYYHPSYLSTMLMNWEKQGKPEIFGLSSTIYYSITQRKWTKFQHPGRASMMSTMIRMDVLPKIKWCDDSYSYTDMHLWTKCNLKGRAIEIRDVITVGIKHGTGLCGGGGHVESWKQYRNDDPHLQHLMEIVSPDAFKFYNLQIARFKTEIKKRKFAKNPFLTIITRSMDGKRPTLFKQHLESINAFSCMDFEQIFIIDKFRNGMLAANSSFQLCKPHVTGQYVHLLDDDDFYLNPNFIEDLRVAAESNPDVIVFKMRILTGDGDQIYPKPGSWNMLQPKRGQIGGSCFVVSADIFNKYIEYFAYPSFGDWNFITRVMAQKGIRVKFVDKLMCETGRVSRGNPE